MKLTCGCKSLSVRAEAAVKYSALVGRDVDISHEGRVTPNAQGVVREAARADNLAVVRAPAQAGDLGPRIYAVYTSSRGRVPEVNVTVVRSTSGGEQVCVPGAPRKSLDSSLVVGLGEFGHGQGTSIPDGNEVVVAAGSKLLSIRAPLQTTDLRGVRDKFGNLVLGDADVMVEDQAASCSRGEQVLVPAHDADAGVMAKHAADLGTLSDVPDLDLARTKANADVGAIAGPLDAADVSVGACLEQTAHTTLVAGPDVDVPLQANGDLVPGAPVEEVEVVIVNEARCIQDTVRACGDSTAELGRAGAGWLDGSVVLLAEVDGLR